jgi:HAD superfamily hydrolase (TIGR01549 family)
MLATNGIRAILFDLDGTLRHNLPSGGEVFTEQAIRLGLQASNEDHLRAMRWEHFYWAGSVELHNDIEKYEKENQAFWQNYSRRRLAALGASGSQVENMSGSINQYMEESYKPENVVPAELPGVLAGLGDLGLRMGVVSNRDTPYWQVLEELGLCQFFEFSLAAGEVNSWKPDTGIFNAALERIEASAQETVYVGDNYFADIVGSRRAGLQPVLYDPNCLFDDPGCRVIASFDELVEILNDR